MKKILLFIVSITICLFSLQVQAISQTISYDETDPERFNDLGIYFGDPAENVIVGYADMYVIIHNPTKLAITVMMYAAKDHCRSNFGNENYSTNFMKILGTYTVYFACVLENKIDQFNLSDEEKQCIENRIYETKSCIALNQKNIAIINKIKLQKEKEEISANLDYIFAARAKFYKKIMKFEEEAEEKRLNKLAEFNLRKNQTKSESDKIIEKNIETCRKYTFEIGTDPFLKCILNLID